MSDCVIACTRYDLHLMLDTLTDAAVLSPLATVHFPFTSSGMTHSVVARKQVSAEMLQHHFVGNRQPQTTGSQNLKWLLAIANWWCTSLQKVAWTTLTAAAASSTATRRLCRWEKLISWSSAIMSVDEWDIRIVHENICHHNGRMNNKIIIQGQRRSAIFDHCSLITALVS